MTAARRILLLGGVDPCGGAGITADAVVASLHGVEPLPVALVLTVQNRRAFTSWSPVRDADWRAAFAAACADGDVHAIKTGLLGSAASVAAVADALAPFRGKVPIVVDPVFGATAGGHAATEDVVAACRERLVPLATVLTPNVPEARALFGEDVRSALALGAGAVLHKGGHAEGEFATDVLHTAAAERRFARRRLPVGPVHGTGCALATSLACWLAHGADAALASQRAGDWLWSRLAALGPPTDGLPRPVPLGGAQPVVITNP
ncbi:MAG: bifunctional hydroxymethylpyrimidine kinase/phosphomethylpyrimidine kinase [Planctomycetes bacterium]|nr:bifunctional hydroxymethylpyrimidine kinase/phosphomethylpyrimidine kinase [Planctomycetota bacterium]